jgi:hypothetical protein
MVFGVGTGMGVMGLGMVFGVGMVIAVIALGVVIGLGAHYDWPALARFDRDGEKSTRDHSRSPPRRRTRASINRGRRTQWHLS